MDIKFLGHQSVAKFYIFAAELMSKVKNSRTK